jgi:lipoprotein-releasing system permease protein
LIPKRKQLSVTLIAIMSVAVISLVVWLLLVFLSITEGMETTWLKKLTDLNAPVRITPTSQYYSSYYYKVDSLSSASGFSYKTIGEKQQASISDPYNPEEDQEVPSLWPDPVMDEKGNLIDPVKGLFSTLENLRPKHPGVIFQDYEMSGALLKLQLLRSQSPSMPGNETLNFLTQVSYLATLPGHAKKIEQLSIAPTAKDINHLFFLANYRLE